MFCLLIDPNCKSISSSCDYISPDHKRTEDNIKRPDLNNNCGFQMLEDLSKIVIPSKQNPKLEFVYNSCFRQQNPTALSKLFCTTTRCVYFVIKFHSIAFLCFFNDVKWLCLVRITMRKRCYSFVNGNAKLCRLFGEISKYYFSGILRGLLADKTRVITVYPNKSLLVIN